MMTKGQATGNFRRMELGQRQWLGDLCLWLRGARFALRIGVVSLVLPWVGSAPLVWAQGQTDGPVVGRVVAWGNNSFGQTNVPADLTNVMAIAAGSVHNLALTSDGMVRAWGRSNHGETNVPPGLSNVVAVAAAGFYGNNYGYSLALKSDGSVVGWGAKSLPPDLSNVVAVAAGAYWWMALKSDGTVRSDYPNLTNGLLALGEAPVSNVVAVACGDRHCLALRRDGTVVGWGTDYDGRATGEASGNGYDSNAIVTIRGEVLSNVVAVAAGSMHSVALRSDGTVIAWGNNHYGQTDVPPGLSNVVAVAKGGNEAADQVLGLQADGRLVWWGGSNAQTNGPVGLSNVVVVAMGSAHSLALVGNGPPVSSVSLSGPTWKANSLSVRLPTQSGRVYGLEYKETPSGADWTPVALAPGSGHMETLTDSNATNSSRFYRVGQW